ncbi:MAG: glycosyltransferase family 2 protein [Anaerolineae bacterium]|nr:glycosyltransferase family 2 protein [Anaerolineae bacterium]
MSLAANAVRVTAAIPCYNGARWIHATVRSLLNQTRLPDEVLVIDDGSSDASADIAASAGARVVRHAVNRGLAVGRNTALAAAAGDILVFIDVDATADPRLVETLLAGFSAPDIAGVGGGGVEAHRETLADEWRPPRPPMVRPAPRRPRPFCLACAPPIAAPPCCQIGGWHGAAHQRRGCGGGAAPACGGPPPGVHPGCRGLSPARRQRREFGEDHGAVVLMGDCGAPRPRRPPWRLYGGAVRGVTTQPLRDAADGRFDLLPLDARIAWVKARAVTRGWLERK